MTTLKGNTLKLSLVGVTGEIGIYFFLIKPFCLFYRKDMPALLYSIHSLGHPHHGLSVICILAPQFD